MREILFRAKAINRDPGREYRTKYKNGDWVYGLLEKPRYPEFPELPAEMRNTDGVSGIEVDFDTIGQYTGLMDKNGVKIFDGDIIKSTETGEIAVVEWQDGHSAFMLCVPKQNDFEYMGEVGSDIMEVIGNIYDNPELLGGDDNA